MSFKQRQNAPVPVEEQVLVVYAGTRGWVDTVPVPEVRRFETELREYFRANAPDLLATIRDSGELPPTDAIDAKLRDFLDGFDTGSAE